MSFAELALPADSDLPEGWVITTLGNVITPSTAKVEPKDCPDAEYLSLEHIEAQTSRILGHGIGSDVGSTKAVFHAGDVLYGKLRPYLNKVCRPDFDGICSTDIIVFPPSPCVDNQFLLRFLMRAEVVEFANHNSNGINLPRTSFEKLSDLEFSLPPLVEQRRIVAKVEQLLAVANASRERLARVPLLMKRFRQSVLAAACSGRLTADWREQNPDVEPASQFLERILAERRARWEAEQVAKKRAKSPTLLLDVAMTLTAQEKAKYQEPTAPDTSELPEIPEEWCWSSLDAICSLIADIDHKMPVAVINGVKFLSAKDLLDDGTLNFTENIKFISEDDFVRLSRKAKPQRGDIIYSRIGARLGKARLVETDERFIVSYSCCVVRLIIVNSRYMARYLDSEAVLRKAMENSRSIGVPDLGLQEIKDFAVPLPPEAEQQEIVRRVEALFKFADAVEKRTTTAIVRADKLTQSILAKAFRGELVPTEAELARAEGRDYEPASALLARIQAERNATAEEAKGLKAKGEKKAAKRTSTAQTTLSFTEHDPQGPNN